jgi:hypothetical protein
MGDEHEQLATVLANGGCEGAPRARQVKLRLQVILASTVHNTSAASLASQVAKALASITTCSGMSSTTTPSSDDDSEVNTPLSGRRVQLEEPLHQLQ